MLLGIRTGNFCDKFLSTTFLRIVLVSRSVELKLATSSDEAWATNLLRVSGPCGVSSVRSDSLEHDEVVYLIAETGNFVGFITYRKIGSQLFNLFVSPQHRKHGVGRLAVAKLVSEMRDRGILQLTVNSVDESVPFWTKTFRQYQVQMEGDNKFIVCISSIP